MLAIRMQRTGRKGHAMFRLVVQDTRRTPTSGKVVALLGSYDPHAKVAAIDKEKIETFLKNGAQPSDRAALLLQKEGIALPKWVGINTTKAGKLRNPEKLRRNQPQEAPAAEEQHATDAPGAFSDAIAKETAEE
jgi:small subunit ribosomal protein S16